MDDMEDDARYPPNCFRVNYHQNSGSAQRSKLSMRNSSYAQPHDSEYVEDEEDEEEGEEEQEEEEVGEVEVEDEEEQEEEVEEEEEEEGDEDEENFTQRDVGLEVDEDYDDDGRYNYQRRIGVDGEYSERHRKKRKLKNLALGYEFAPRVAAPLDPAPPPQPSYGARNSPVDWTEHETFVLLDAWGDRFLQLGRKSLRSDEWLEVASKVSEDSNTVRKDTQCRNRLDTLKKKYKKERMRLAETGSTTSKWVYFKKMDKLMTASPRQPGLSCGFDSGEYVFMNPRIYLNRSNGLDEMRDSPGNSESSGAEEDDSDGLPPRRTKFREDADDGSSSFRLLADSIQKFSEIYENIENSKRQQMVELEKMRMEFHRDLEMQKRQILERTQAEIAKIRQDDEDIDISAENMSE